MKNASSDTKSAAKRDEANHETQRARHRIGLCDDRDAENQHHDGKRPRKAADSWAREVYNTAGRKKSAQLTFLSFHL